MASSTFVMTVWRKEPITSPVGRDAGKEEGSPSSFPVVVDGEVYRQLAGPLKRQGAVRVERISGKLAVGDQLFSDLFRRAYLRDPLFLYVEGGPKIVIMDQPHLILGDAWTIAKWDGKLRNLSFTFELGKEGWETQLTKKCWEVEQRCKQHGG